MIARRLLYAVTVLAGVIGLLAGCGNDHTPTAPSSGSTNTPITSGANAPGLSTTVQPQAAVDVSNVVELARYSSDIVVGTVEKVSATEQRIPGMVQTRYQLAVSKSLKGDAHDTIPVVQMGGWDLDTGATTVVAADSPLAVGHTYVIYLKRSADGTVYSAIPGAATHIELSAASLESFRRSGISPEVASAQNALSK